MSHLKYPSIENTYNSKNLEWWLERHPDLRNVRYVIESKVDGSNIQINIKPNGEVRYGSRNQLISLDNGGFYNLKDTIIDYEDVIERFKSVAKQANKEFHFYGEFFGPGIQKRVDYSARRIRFFGMAIDGEMCSPQKTYKFFIDNDLNELLIHSHDVVDSLEEALNFNVEFLSVYNPVEGNWEEGIVIKPWDEVYKDVTGKTFYLKKKNKKHAEKEQKTKKPKQEIDPVLDKYQQEVMEMVTQNRLDGLFSKEGRRINEVNEMGFWIGRFISDVKDEFYRENPDIQLTKAEEKVVFNIGKFVSDLVRNELEAG